MFVTRTEDVHDVAAQGGLAGGRDHGHPYVPPVDQGFEEVVLVDLVAFGHGEMLTLQQVRMGPFLDQVLQRQENAPALALVGQGEKGLPPVRPRGTAGILHIEVREAQPAALPERLLGVSRGKDAAQRGVQRHVRARRQDQDHVLALLHERVARYICDAGPLLKIRCWRSAPVMSFCRGEGMNTVDRSQCLFENGERPPPSGGGYASVEHTRTWGLQDAGFTTRRFGHRHGPCSPERDLRCPKGEGGQGRPSVAPLRPPVPYGAGKRHAQETLTNLPVPRHAHTPKKDGQPGGA